MSKPQIIKATLASDYCVCEAYDEATNEPKLDEHGNPVRADECYDECFEQSILGFTESILKPYLAVKGWDYETEPIKITCAGSRYADCYPYNLLDRLMLNKLTRNSDFRLEFEFDGENLTAVRYSHAEPAGTGKFEFAKNTIDDWESYIKELQK